MENELLQCHQWILKFCLLTDWHFELLGGVPVKKPPCMCKRVFMSNWMNLEHFRPVQWNVFVPPPTKFRQNCPPKRVLATMLISWQKIECKSSECEPWTIIKDLHWGGIFESNFRMFEAHFDPKKRKIATFTWFATKARMLPVKCASSDSYVPPTMVAVVDKLLDWAIPTKYHSTRTNLWQKLPAKLSYRMVPKSGCVYL